MTKNHERMTYKEAEALLEPLYERMAVDAADGSVGAAVAKCLEMRTESTVAVVDVLNRMLATRPDNLDGLCHTGVEMASLIDDSWIADFAWDVADFCRANMLTEMHATRSGDDVVTDNQRTSCLLDDYAYEEYLKAFLLLHKHGTVLTVGYSSLKDMGKEHITVIVDGALYRFVM